MKKWNELQVHRGVGNKGAELSFVPEELLGEHGRNYVAVREDNPVGMVIINSDAMHGGPDNVGILRDVVVPESERATGLRADVIGKLVKDGPFVGLYTDVLPTIEEQRDYEAAGFSRTALKKVGVGYKIEDPRVTQWSENARRNARYVLEPQKSG